MALDFDEEKHPRDDKGRFSGGLSTWVGKKLTSSGKPGGDLAQWASAVGERVGALDTSKKGKPLSEYTDQRRRDREAFPRTKLEQPKGGTVNLDKPTTSKRSAFERAGGDEKMIQKLAASSEMKTILMNNKLAANMRMKYNALRNEEDAITAQLKNKDNTPEERASLNERFDANQNARKDVSERLHRLLDSNARFVGELLDRNYPGKGLGDLHEQVTRDWISNVASGKAHEMQLVSNALGFKWKTKDAKEKQLITAINKKDFPGGVKEYMEKTPSGKAMKAYFSAMYNLSQASLRAAGYKPGDTVTLYRGMSLQNHEYNKLDKIRDQNGKAAAAKFDKEWPNDPRHNLGEAARQNLRANAIMDARLAVPDVKLHVEQRPLTSWSDKPDIAASFPGAYLLKSKVPIERVFANYRLFKNSYDENEFVVLGATDVRSKLMAKDQFKKVDEEEPKPKLAFPLKKVAS